MANATTRVNSAAVNWGDDAIDLTPAATAATYYPGAMIARNASGYAVKCDDTAGIAFAGMNVNTVRLAVTGDETVGELTADHSKQLHVRRPWRIALDIASAAAGDEGRAVYAVDDNHCGYSSNNSILLGWVDQVLSSTRVLINPLYAPLNPAAITNNTLALTGSTGANTLTFPDNLADAFSLQQGSNKYLTFTSTDGSELITAYKGVTLANATTPILSLATGMTNTGYVEVNGKTSGKLKITTADATAQTVTLTAAAQTSGASTWTIPDAAGAAQTFATLALTQTLTNKTLASPVFTGKATLGVVATPVAATGAGGGVSGAAALSANNLVYVSSDGATKGVKFPTSAAGDWCVVINTSSTACNLFAASGGTINGGSTDAGCAVPASKGVLAFSSAANTWTVFDLTAHSGAAA